LALNNNLHDEGQNSTIALAAYQELAKRDPAQALSQLAQMAPGSLQQAAYRDVFRVLGRSLNPAQVQSAVNDLPPGPQHDAALRGLVAGWSTVDPQDALNFVINLPSGNAALLQSTLLNVAMSAQQPALAAQFVNPIQDPAARDAAIAAIAPIWGAGPNKDPAAALDWLSQVATGDTYDQAVSSVFTYLSKQDPATAASLLNKVTDPAAQQQVITMVANSWGSTDPQAALTWAQTLPAPAATLNSIVSSWAKTDPNAALAFVQNSADPSAYLSSAPALAKAVAASDPQDALAFAENLPTGSMKTQSLNNVLATEAQTDFTDAWNSAVNLPPSKSQNVVMANLVGVEATQDPTQAAALLDQFSDPATQLTAAGNLSATWVKLDPQAFTVWLTGLPAGDVRDTAIAKLAASSQAQKNPAGVLQWVNTVSNPQIKATLLQKLAPAQTGGN
jgi:hypothetical protein